MNLINHSLELFGLCSQTSDACRQSAYKLLRSDESLHFLECARQCELLMSLLIHNADIDYVKFEECADACSQSAAICDKEDNMSFTECGNICRECEELCNIMAEKSFDFYQSV